MRLIFILHIWVFKLAFPNELNDYWHFFLFGHIEILKANCHKRKKVVQVRNLFVKFEITFIFLCNVKFFFGLLVYQEIRPYKIWWKEPKQSTHWDLIEVVWHNNLEMKDRKYLFAYCMTFWIFTYLVRKLEPFVKFRATMFIRAPLELKKTIGLCYIDLHMGLMQTLLLMDSLLELLHCVTMLILLSMF